MALLDGPRGHKVGIAYEGLMLWGITQGLGYQCLGRDVQVFDQGRTVGRWIWYCVHRRVK